MEGNRHPELESLWDFAPLEIRGGNLVLAAEGGYPPKKRPAKAPLAGAMWFRRGRSVPRLSGRTDLYETIPLCGICSRSGRSW